jgi:hypothetical protein
MSIALVPLLLVTHLGMGHASEAPETTGATVRWNGRTFDADEPPAELPVPARAAIAFWAPWAEAERYRMSLDDEGRLLLLEPARGGPAGLLKLVERTAELFDELLPLPADAEVRDPPADPHAWGSADVPRDTETIAFLALRDEEDYASSLRELPKSNPYLAGWAEAAASRLGGYVLSQPLCGAYVEVDARQKEWNPKNELVNRAAQLLLLRRFGPPPNWLVQGFAWHVELEVCRAIYCFPYRAGFVSAAEHKGWDGWLRERFRGRADDPLRVDEFAAWPAGSYDESAARVSFGVVEFLLRHHAEALPGFLEDLRRFRDENDRVKRSDGTWERQPGYEIPLADQTRLLQERFGEAFFEEVTRAFRR